MAINEEGFGIEIEVARLSTNNIAKQIQDQLNNIKGLTVKVGVDTAGIKQSIQNAVNAAGKDIPKISGGIPAGKTTGNTSLNATAKQIERIQTLLKNGRYAFNISELETGFKRMGLSAQEAASKVQGVRAAYDAMKGASGVEQLVTAQKAFNLELSTGQNELRQMRTDASEVSDALKTAKLSDDITNKLNKNTAMTKKAKEELRAYVDLLNSGTKSSGERQAIQQRVNSIMTEQRAMGKLGGSWIDTLNKGIKKFTEWGFASGAVMRVFNEFRKGVQTVEDLDEALTNINYTMDVSSAQLGNISRSAIQASKGLHTSLSTVMDAVKTYANANETAESIIEKAKPTIMMSNASGMDVENTVDVLQGTMEQFDLAEDKLMHISDVMQTVSASMPYDFSKGIKELSEGIQASGSVAKDSGYELENYTALLGTLIYKTRQSGSEIGRALRTMFVRTTKASSSALAGGEVSEEDISNAEAALRRVGIEVRSDAETFRDFDEIMGDLYEKVDSLSDVDLSNIAYEVASTRQTNVFKMMVKAYGDYQEMAEKAADADGMTLANQDKYAESLKGHMQELKAVSESFWTNVLDSDTLKVGVDTLTTLLKLLDKLTDLIGELGTIGLGAGLFAGFKNDGRDRMYSL